MSIQSSINQVITSAIHADAARKLVKSLSPEEKERAAAEQREAARQERVTKAQETYSAADLAVNAAAAGDLSEEGRAELGKLYEGRRTAAQALYRQDPTAENFERLHSAARESKGFSDENARRMEAANLKAAEERKSKEWQAQFIKNWRGY